MMDLSPLTRPAILCQCARCSSSLAALENDWAKLSNSYSIPAGWLSVNLNRISISPQRKQIPQTSDLNVLRGRILQEISCRLCQQKLGVLSMLDSGPRVFWKLAKVSFREIVTMRTVEPIIREGALESLILACPPDPAGQGPDFAQRAAAALIPGNGGQDKEFQSVQQQIQHQGMSIHQISSFVNNLQDAVAELKDAFTALRIELNGPNNRLSLEAGNAENRNLEMIATVLKELKSKSEEIERLKLEIETLKFKNRFMEEQRGQQLQHSAPLTGTSDDQQQLPRALPALAAPETVDGGGRLPEVQSPGLLQASRKRSWPGYGPSGRTDPIADSFDGAEGEEDEILDDISLTEGGSVLPMRIPLKEPGVSSRMNTPEAMALDQSRPESPMLRIEVSRSRHQTPHVEGETRMQQQRQQQSVIVKRSRLSHTATDASQQTPQSNGNGPLPDKRRPGRPRKSFSQTAKPDLLASPNATTSGGADASFTQGNEPRNERSTSVTTTAGASNTATAGSATGGVKTSLSSRPKSRGRPRLSTPAAAITSTEEVAARDRDDGGGGGLAHLPPDTAGHIVEVDLASEPASAVDNGQAPGSSATDSAGGEKLLSTEQDNASREQSNTETGAAGTGREKRKAQLAARDTLARLAMQQEEAMEANAASSR